MACSYERGYAWEELRSLADKNIDSARDELIDKMADYQGALGYELILVFDAYRVKGLGHTQQVGEGFRVVYSAEGETADRYIERLSAKYGQKYDMIVAASDRLVQTVSWGNNCRRMSARELKLAVEQELEDLMKQYREKK